MKKHNKYVFLLMISVWLSACSYQESTDHTSSLVYPETRKSEHEDDYFGHKVPDPYRWLEDDTSEETATWVKAENEVTFGYLNNITFRDKVKARLEELMNYERVSAPFIEGGYEYFYKNDGLQDHSVLYRRKAGSEEAEVFLDPNMFSEDGTVGLRGVFFTKDGDLSAHMISDGGSDWRKVITMNVETREVIEDTPVNVKFSGISWQGNEGFYYSSYDKPEDGSQLSAKTQYHKLYYHKLDTPQKEDVLVFGGEQQPNR